MPPHLSLRVPIGRPMICGRCVSLPIRPHYHLRYASTTSSNDPKLHPNPNVSPSTEPSSASPSSNPARADSNSAPEASDTADAVNASSNVNPKGPNMEQLPHVSEEAAAMSKSMGESGPAVDQGTPVQDVLKEKGDKDGFEKLPKVMKESMSQQKRSYSTVSSRKRLFHSSSRRYAGIEQDFIDQISDEGPPPPSPEDVQKAQQIQQQQPRRIPTRDEQDYPGQYHEIDDEEAMAIACGELPNPMEMRAQAQVITQQRQGLKFGDPSTPANRQKHLRRRYDGVMEQVTNMIMRDGKKSVAQRNLAEILTYLRTAPSPTPTPSGTVRRLLPLPQSTPTQSHLPLHPVFYLTHAIDSIAPLMRIRSQKGLAGGGVALQIPVPLSLRQRRRAALVWILEAVDKRKGGTSGFARRFAEEIVGIVEGRSSVWGKRENVHRLATMGRSNLGLVRGGRR
ncbi:MAG: hypothetical protein Q9159_004959 [Coniocarpon cinnabarinum]